MPSMSKYLFAFLAVMIGGVMLSGCSMVEVGAVSTETPTRTPIPSIRLPTREPTQIPVPTPTWTPLPTKTSTPIPTRTPTPVVVPTRTPIPTPIGYHWSTNPNLYIPFRLENYEHFHLFKTGNTVGGFVGSYGCNRAWEWNNGILIQIATHGERGANYFTPEEKIEFVKPYNFPLEICEKHYPRSYIEGDTYVRGGFVPPTDEEWISYGLDLKNRPKPVPTPDWSKGTRELMPVFIVGDQAEYERLLAEHKKYLDGLRSHLTDDERSEEELEGDDEE